MKNKIILGIDPGTYQSAYVFIIGTEIIEAGYIDNMHMIYKVQDSNYNMCAVEGIRYHGVKAGKETFITCELSGKLYQAAKSRGKKAAIIYRSTATKEFKSIRAYLCGSNRASGKEVDDVVKKMFPGCWIRGREHGPLYLKVGGSLKNHKLSAAAVALVYQGSKKYQEECLG